VVDAPVIAKNLDRRLQSRNRERNRALCPCRRRKKRDERQAHDRQMRPRDVHRNRIDTGTPLTPVLPTGVSAMTSA